MHREMRRWHSPSLGKEMDLLIFGHAGARVLVFAYAMASSGVPAQWAAGPARSGVNFLDGLSERSVARIARAIASLPCSIASSRRSILNH